MKRIILMTAMITSMFLSSAAVVSACSCLPPASPKESLEQSTAVFAGKVIEIKVPDGMAISSTADSVRVTFEVSKIWKGPNYKTLVVTTPISGPSCGYFFKQGEEYIVYAYKKENELSTNTCTRTKLLANAQEDSKELGGKILPKTFNSIQILSIVGGLIVLISIIAFIVGKYKK